MQDTCSDVLRRSKKVRISSDKASSRIEADPVSNFQELRIAELQA
jgi:hypothetical protein